MEPSLHAVWNHSIDVWLDDSFETASQGTKMLAGIQHLHNNVIPEGLAWAVETFEEVTFRRAAEGLRYFGFRDLDPFFTDLLVNRNDLEYLNSREDEYFELFPEDAVLERAILARLSEFPDEFDDGEP
ncbi:hypothetical protein KZ829_07915 [Actinoplanes hulinensis]|uniref:Uncharacterized protein n=1 Tax=Actinoplanes hulinensis TaxID=1144547 RepID=A0ABS7AY49_9ACTN|nr:hypothetical protein [Actinoplanes hulinensis]MBW6433667.1 hypothetical protein [Actinoplanes hulinensis]